MIIVSIPVCILGLAGNGMVILFLCCTIKKNKFTVYVMNIAIADFAVLLYLFCYFLLFVEPIPINVHISRLIQIMYILGRNFSFYILTALCVERYLSVFFPVWCQHHRPRHFSVILSIILWAFSCLISLLEDYACYPRFYSYLYEHALSCDIVITFEMSLGFLIFIPIMVFCTLSVFIRKGGGTQQIPQALLDNTIMAVVLLYLVFDPSVRILEIIDYWYDDIVNIPVFITSVIFDCITSSINPYLYFVIGWWNRQRAWETLDIFLERALKYERTVIQRTQADQEKA
ncbi:mas-related G-protein coupled receptor member H-like [Rhineura floridana]|uniref:mas-related G-protein coupled receptor member H-like n=1 Tax=Rhineura floridana TaxID=261503 RepID=UPI002AC851BE|nr:mas-related G-protein coupled receptor member H-like [Rhineura floridana]